MPKVSVVIPVYKAEGMLRRCVESVIFGEEKDLEIILIEDCSPDGSWNLCQQLAHEYSKVICLRNDQNRGVSYTRNRGIDAATGKYLLFVDSDDWVSGNYVKAMIDATEENPGRMVVCGFTFIDHIRQDRVKYGIYDTPTLPRSEFMKLTDAVMLQQLWNKVFRLDEIRKAGIRFDETICMGEDYQFVMDVIESLNYKECVIIDKPLYYYVRYTSGSLMNSWAEHESYEDCKKRKLRLDKLCGITESSLEEFDHSFAYRIVRESNLPRKRKLEIIHAILGKKKGKRFYHKQKLQGMKEKLVIAGRLLSKYRGRLTAKVQSDKNRMTIRKVSRLLVQNDVTVISQNCIGGVFSHDMGMEFRSPTVNVFIPAADFIKFVQNLEHYLNTELVLHWNEEYPIGTLEDIKVMFVHYDTCQQAREAWERRKKRVNLSKILVLSTDRDGFDDAVFEQWKTISYPKLLFTAREEYAEHPDALYFPQHKANGCVPDLIPKREFYKDHVLISKVNAVGSSC